MEANIERSTPNTTIDHVNQRAWLHLNRKAQGLMAHTFRDQSQVDAIAITGKTGWMTLDGKDDLSQFEFHFIQLAKNNVDQTMYAGFRSSEGSVELNLATPPVWPAKYTKKFCLDSVAWPLTCPLAIRGDLTRCSRCLVRTIRAFRDG